MKAIELSQPRLDAFRAATVATPEPQRGEVLIRQRAASLNFVDVRSSRSPTAPARSSRWARALRVSARVIASSPMPSRAGSAAGRGPTR